MSTSSEVPAVPESSTGPEFYRKTLHNPTVAGSNMEEIVHATKFRFQDITEIQSWRGQDREICLTSQFSHRPVHTRNRDAFKEYSVVLRRIVDRDSGKAESINFEIQSETLRKEFRRLITDSAAGTVDLEAYPIQISQPYQLLFYAREKINGYTSESSNLEKEMRLITNFLANNEELRDVQTMYDQLRPRKKISYGILWTIYRPGELVFVNVRKTTECWRFKSCNGSLIRGHGMDYDGTRLGLVERAMWIPPFSGVVDIESLPVVPLDIYPEAQRAELKREFINRGKRFKELLIPRHYSYEGPLWFSVGTSNADEIQDLHSGDRVKANKGCYLSEYPDLQINERVMVDYPGYLDECPSARPDLLGPKIPTVDVIASSIEVSAIERTSSDMSATSTLSMASVPLLPPIPAGSTTTESIPTGESILTNDEYILCPARIPGFSLSEKQWGYFLISELEEPEWRKEAFDLLEVEDRKKDLVKVLVEGHKAYGTGNCDTFDDIVRGKGNGLVFMLHGPPGLGKTLMAESIAERSERPLYQVSSGELTNGVSPMETQIKHIFKYGHRWNAIVLLDEADVLMSNRNEGDLASNSIVSVFLRLIEYYEGILFLTTNRPTHFDAAIHNRVHLTIRFDILTPTIRVQIWRNILKQNFKPLGELPDCWTERVFQVLGKFDINGRTIKNLLRTASCYARSKNRPLGIIDLNEVMQVNLTADEEKAKKFRDDLGNLEGLINDPVSGGG